jgi:OHCU decarboxylase
VAALKRAIEYFQSKEGVWFATRDQIARHWAQEHPVAPVLRITDMDRAEFVDRFGGVCEHSAWVAERAFDLEFGPTHDCAAGAHSLLARVFRAASTDERLGVLRAHPDLAGKLAAAKRLTAESTAEQASAGLDSLTAEEHAAFTRLNAEYTETFGFPFIIAVRDHDKASILAAFQRRVAQDRATEFAEACRQVERIAEFRVYEIFGE